MVIVARLLISGRQSEVCDDWKWCKTTPQKDRKMVLDAVQKQNEFIRTQAVDIIALYSRGR